MTKNKIFIFVTVLIVAMLVVGTAFAGMSGPAASGVQVQNLSSTNKAYVNVQLWNQNGTPPLTISAPGGDEINENAAKNYYLPSIPGVTTGAYSMVMSAGEQIAAIARTDWNSVGGAAIYSTIQPGTNIIIPLVLKSFAGQTSHFSIQNTNVGATINDVQVVLYGRGSSTPVVTLPTQSITAGTSKSYSMDDAMWGTLPNNGGDLGVPTGFAGLVRISSATDLVVQTYADVAGSRGVTGFSGAPTASAASTLYCPLIRANYYGDTGISIVNPNNSSVEVDITFYADPASPQGPGPYLQQDIPISANSSFIAFQGFTGNSRVAGLPGGSQSSSVLTNDGFFGVAKLQATGAILAVVNDTKFGSSWSVESQSSYNCIGSAEAGSRFALPLLRKYHLSAQKLTTGIQIQNTGGSSITASLDLYNWDGSHQSTSNPTPIVIPANGSGNFWNGNLTGLPTVPPSLGGSGWFGSGILTITGGNAIVVVSDEGFGTTAIDSASYNGLKMP